MTIATTTNESRNKSETNAGSRDKNNDNRERDTTAPTSSNLDPQQFVLRRGLGGAKQTSKIDNVIDSSKQRYTTV
jgi:hypothetical protein